MHDPRIDDRARGILLGSAVGDALGAPLEFRPPHRGPIGMTGGGVFGWAPGQWTDDTEMAAVLAHALADHPRDPSAALDAAAAGWQAWAFAGPRDIGGMVRRVLTGVPLGTARSALERHTLETYRAAPGRSDGNGSLMRLGPVAAWGLVRALPPERIADVAAAQSAITHPGRDSVEACRIWAVLTVETARTGRIDIDGAVDTALPDAGRRDALRARLAAVAALPPTTWHGNGYVVTALQQAAAVVVQADRFEAAIELACRVGDDADTVAAVAGQLAGARWGAGAIPAEWLAPLHGGPGLDAEALGAHARRFAG